MFIPKRTDYSWLQPEPLNNIHITPGTEKILPTNPLANLVSIPLELRSIISSNLNRNDQLIFSRLSRSFPPPTTRTLWTALNLRLQRNYGKFPLIQPVAKADNPEAYMKWVGPETRAAEERYRSGLKEKMKIIFNRGDEEKWRMVKLINMVTRHGSIPAMMMILDNVAPNLEALFLDGHTERFHKDPVMAESLDASIALAPDLVFPNLKYLAISANAMSHRSLVLSLCAKSPSLNTLLIDHILYPMANVVHPKSIDPAVKSNLRTLRFSFGGEHAGDEVEEFLADQNGIKTLNSVMDMCENLQQLDLIYRGRSPYILTDIITMLGAHPTLRDLYWPTRSSTANRQIAANEDSTRFAELRRLVVYPLSRYKASATDADGKQPDDLLIPQLIKMPHLPNLERLYYLSKSPTNVISIKPTRQTRVSFGPLRLYPAFASKARENASLKSIYILDQSNSEGSFSFSYLDKLEMENRTGDIFSLKHLDEELLIVSFCHNVVEIFDEAVTVNTPTTADSANKIKIKYMTREGQERKKGFELQGKRVLQVYTDYDGLPVPFEVIAKMREVEGVSADWCKTRGRPVREKAWKILTDWRDSQRSGEETIVDG